MEGRFDQARALYQRSHEIVGDLGPSVTVAGASLESSRVEMLAGDLLAAERELRRDFGTLDAMGERYYRSSVAGFLSHALYALGQLDEAAHFVGVAEELSDLEDMASQVTWRTARAKVWARRGGGEAAVAFARAAVALAVSNSNIEQRAEALTDLAEVLEAVGELEMQEPPLREALALFVRKGDLVSANRIRERLSVLSQAASQKL
jgi:tetratricopeptide (TPR) repeat protein